MACPKGKDLRHRIALLFLATLILGVIAWNLDAFGIFRGVLGFVLFLAAVLVRSRRQPQRLWRRILVGIVGVVLIFSSGLADIDGDKFARRQSSFHRGLGPEP